MYRIAFRCWAARNLSQLRNERIHMLSIGYYNLLDISRISSRLAELRSWTKFRVEWNSESWSRVALAHQRNRSGVLFSILQHSLLFKLFDKYKTKESAFNWKFSMNFIQWNQPPGLHWSVARKREKLYFERKLFRNRFVPLNFCFHGDCSCGIDQKAWMEDAQ